MPLGMAENQCGQRVEIYQETTENRSFRGFRASDGIDSEAQYTYDKDTPVVASPTRIPRIKRQLEFAVNFEASFTTRENTGRMQIGAFGRSIFPLARNIKIFVLCGGHSPLHACGSKQGLGALRPGIPVLTRSVAWIMVFPQLLPRGQPFLLRQ
ncbi:uncharacterized protein EI90DRAFT_3014436 [Cantharellus anzutake]|uniref:uncharacterized protein n=1 Tax=Cantharellus anzutake TaxID=1750568 RepID=UPI001904FBC2|nr:uncharacterized protein EI90DRAFT_3014436 [Cantharellus anzutake]KAF8335815.1 hypothetical protein EI90DRAFT_3014436 [Cantharellus anzutake]